MENHIFEWLNLLFRWFHVIVGAGWIGTSFYFNWLNHAIRDPEEPIDNIKGQLFAVHGGAFYEVRKHADAPAILPKTIHWFKWEAYLTWISGFGLVNVVYYWNAKLYLLNPEMGITKPWHAIVISLSLILGCWLIYDRMCRSFLRKLPVDFAFIGFLLAGGLIGVLTYIFPPRAAYIHFGVILGTIMAANVFFVIIPSQRVMLDAKLYGVPHDENPGAAGALRSLHNNYLTIPVLFIMVSNHFPMTYGHSFNWAILIALSIAGAATQHYLNLKHKGKHKVWILPVAALIILSLTFVTAPDSVSSKHDPNQPAVTYRQVAPILKKRCAVCHAARPTFPGYAAPPQGAKLETYAQAKALRNKIKQNAISSKIMPPGNLTKITAKERALLGAWIDSGARKW